MKNDYLSFPIPDLVVSRIFRELVRSHATLPTRTKTKEKENDIARFLLVHRFVASCCWDLDLEVRADYLMFVRGIKANKSLRRAAENGDEALARYLVRKRGADPRAKRDYALRAAARCGDAYRAYDRILHEDGTRNSVEAYGASVKGAKEEWRARLVRFLIREFGADVHAREDEALRWAARKGRADLVKELIVEHGANPRVRYDQPLRWAARRGHRNVVETLLLLAPRADYRGGVRPDYATGAGSSSVSISDFGSGSRYGAVDVHAGKDYALRWAVRKGHTDIAILLLERFGADARVLMDEPLRVASARGDRRLFDLLWHTYGADVRANKDEVLMIEASKGNVQVLREIVRHVTEVSGDRFSRDTVIRCLKAGLTRDQTPERFDELLGVFAPDVTHDAIKHSICHPSTYTTKIACDSILRKAITYGDIRIVDKLLDREGIRELCMDPFFLQKARHCATEEGNYAILLHFDTLEQRASAAHLA